MAGLAEQWFRIADEDKDGKIAGGEAVRFFTRSGLPQDVLRQIWDLASGGAPALNQLQFNAAMRLVALAQINMGRLPPDQARAVAMGGGPQVPLPRMAGLAAPPPPAAGPPGAPGAYTLQVTGAVPPGYGPPQVTGASGYTPQLTGASYNPQLTGASYAPQVTGAGGPPSTSSGGGGYPPRPAGFAPPSVGAPSSSGGYTPQLTGASYAPQVTGGFPPVSAEDMSRYKAQFGQLDRDEDGLVQGSDCFGVFMQTGLEKRALKVIWDLVPAGAGVLNAEQFVQAVYLMDCAKRGTPLPPALPRGAFPPLAAGVTMPAAAAPGGGAARPLSAAGGPPAAAPQPQQPWSLATQFGDKTASKAVAEVYDQTLPRLPGVPSKVVYDAKGAPAAARGSEVPNLDDEVSRMLGGPEKDRWESAQSEAKRKEEELRKAEADVEAAKRRLQVFQEALGEIMLFRSRADVALLQAQDQAARLGAEAEETERRYHAAHLAAQGQFQASEEARKELQAALAKKQEAQNRLLLLQQEIEMLNNMNPQEMAALQAEVAGLVAQVAAAESKKASLELQLDAGRKQRTLLAARAQDVELSAAAGEAELGRVLGELKALGEKLDAAAAAPVGGEGGDAGGMELGDLCDALVRAAGAYRSLLGAVQGRGADVPYAAALNNVGALVWVDTVLAGAADWMDGDAPPPGDEGDAGYVVVNALPELEGVPPGLLRASALAAPLMGPLKRALAPAAAAAKPEAAAAAAEAPKPDAAAAEKAPAVAAEAAAAKGAAAGPGSGAGTPKAMGTPKAAATPKAGAVAAVAAAVAGAAAAGAAAAAAAADDDDAAPAAAEEPAAAVVAAAEETAEEAPAAAPADAADAGAKEEAPAAAASFEDDAFGAAAGEAAGEAAAAVAATAEDGAAAAEAPAAEAADAPEPASTDEPRSPGFEGPPAFGRTSTADSAALDGALTNPFASFEAPAEGGAASGLTPRHSDATDSSYFEDNAF